MGFGHAGMFQAHHVILAKRSSTPENCG